MSTTSQKHVLWVGQLQCMKDGMRRDQAQRNHWTLVSGEQNLAGINPKDYELRVCGRCRLTPSQMEAIKTWNALVEIHGEAH